MPNLTGLPHVASVTWSGSSLGGLKSSGVESGGIQADNRGVGDAIIDASGNVEVVSGNGVYGLLAHTGDSFPSGIVGSGSATVDYDSGMIDVNGNRARGILAWVDGDGSVTATTDPGTVIDVNGAGSRGVYVFAGSATAADNRTLTATVASTITSSGSG